MLVLGLSESAGAPLRRWRNDMQSGQAAEGTPLPPIAPSAKRPYEESTASDLTVRERILLFCVASGTDWQRAGVPGGP